MTYKQVNLYNYKIKNIDATVQAATLMGSPLPGGFRVTHLIIDLTSVASLVTAPIISLGKTSSTYNDIIPATNLLTLTSSSKSFIIPTSNVMVDMLSGDGLYFNVSTSAVSGTYMIDVTIAGFYDL
jgi:hypothetical protein